jgi:hypothetical protein
MGCTETRREHTIATFIDIELSSYSHSRLRHRLSNRCQLKQDDTYNIADTLALEEF